MQPSPPPAGETALLVKPPPASSRAPCPFPQRPPTLSRASRHLRSLTSARRATAHLADGFKLPRHWVNVTRLGMYAQASVGAWASTLDAYALLKSGGA